MNKRIILPFLFLLLFLPQSVLAHTSLKSTSPISGAVVDEHLQDITLEYETGIDSLSTFEVYDSSGKTHTPDELVARGTKMTGSFVNPLANDTYTVKWNVISDDGHPVSGEFAFTVDATPGAKLVYNQPDVQMSDGAKKSNNHEGLYTALLTVLVVAFVTVIFLSQRARR
jgi:methionine-rich copper-binding protein CopC